MKIKLLHTQVAVMSKDHKYSFNARDHVLEYIAHLQMFKIDETLVPVSNIREVLIEEEPPAKKAVTTEDSLDKIDEIFNEVKRSRKK